MYAGMPNEAYKIAKTNGQEKARYPYVNGSPANRHFTSNPDLAEQTRRKFPWWGTITAPPACNSSLSEIITLFS